MPWRTLRLPGRRVHGRERLGARRGGAALGAPWRVPAGAARGARGLAACAPARARRGAPRACAAAWPRRVRERARRRRSFGESCSRGLGRRSARPRRQRSARLGGSVAGGAPRPASACGGLVGAPPASGGLGLGAPPRRGLVRRLLRSRSLFVSHLVQLSVSRSRFESVALARDGQRAREVALGARCRPAVFSSSPVACWKRRPNSSLRSSRDVVDAARRPPGRASRSAFIAGLSPRAARTWS